MRLKERYEINKKSKVGDECVCPSCCSVFIKDNYQQAFCRLKTGTKCKDRYWNTVTPKKRNNTTRISPASSRWLATQESNREINIYDTFHPFEGLNDEEYKN